MRPGGGRIWAGTMAFVSRIVTSGFRVYWRATRSFTLSAEACLIDGEDRIALVQSAMGRGWQLPRTEVHKGEALDEALQRFLVADYRIRLASRPELFWMYEESQAERHGMTGLYVVRHWRQDAAPAAGLSFFGLDALPPGLPPQDAARIRQAAEGRAPFEVC